MAKAELMPIADYELDGLITYFLRPDVNKPITVRALRELQSRRSTSASAEKLAEALREVRHWIVCSGAHHPSVPCAKIDAALSEFESTRGNG